MFKKALVYIFLIVLVFSMSVIRPTSSKAAGVSYYVATNGSDSNNGTSISTPFRNIQKAASVAQAGDTVYIRQGTYRETITPANSGSSGNRIKFTNYNGEVVTVSGADSITGWTNESTNIYYATMTWDLKDKNQVFVNSTMVDEARWPNNGGTLLQPTMATVGSGSTTTLVDASLTGPDDYWTGATLNIISGKAWKEMSSTITSYVSSTHALAFGTLKKSTASYVPQVGNKYFLSGLKKFMDSNGEWWYDSANSRLYMYNTSSPSGVEAKHRGVAFDLSGKNYIEINGINIFAATITTDANTNYALIKKGVFKYVSHSDLNTTANEQDNLGIILNGTYNELNSNEIAYSSGSLVTVKGDHNNVINNYIHDGGYIPDDDGLVNLKGESLLISHNTISDAGRFGISIIQASKVEIQYNNVYDALWLTTDGGVIYSYNTDAQNSEIHHNKIHDNKAAVNASVLYLDSFSNNFIIYDNILYNGEGIRFNTPSHNNLLYNNTMYDVTTGFLAWGWNDFSGTRIYNNIMTGFSTADANPSANSLHGNNITSSPLFVDQANHDYRLQSGSPAVDYGVVEPGITDGYIGSAPDAGAIEYNNAMWTAGHNFAAPPTPTFTTPNVLHMNRVVNGGFEKGDLTSWTKTDAQTATIINDNHWGKDYTQGSSSSQLYGLRLGGATGVDGVEQTITGLTANTTYTVTGWVRAIGGETAMFGVKNYGGGDTNRTSTSSTWTLISITFTTGSTDTSATIYFKKSSAGTNYIFCDDASLQYSGSATPGSPITIQAENYNSMSGINNYTTFIGSADDGDWVRYDNVNLGSGYGTFRAYISSLNSGGAIEIRLDSTTGTLCGTLNVTNTGSWSTYTEQTASLSNASGTHNVYLVFKNITGVANVDWFKFQ